MSGYNRSITIDSSGAQTAVGLVRLPVRPGESIAITFDYRGQWAGVSMAFDDPAPPTGLDAERLDQFGADSTLIINPEELARQAGGDNTAPVVNAGADQTITLPATATLNGTAVDDGLPTSSALTYAWTKQSGPGTATFGSASSASTTVAFSAVGTYILRLTVSDGALGRSDEVTVTVSATGSGGGTGSTSGGGGGGCGLGAGLGLLLPAGLLLLRRRRLTNGG